MGAISGERTVEIGATLDVVFAIAADIERAPEWQASLTDVEVLERDGERRATSVETESDARVRAIRSRLRYVYDPLIVISWEQERGDVKDLRGSWRFEDLGGGRTRATYALEVDPGRMLGMLLRGGAEEKVREYLVGGAAEGLKARAEAG